MALLLAGYRKTAAELVQRYPAVEAALRGGKLCLSSVVELAKVIAPDNSADVLPRFFGLSSRDAALVAASIRPVEDPPRREVVTSLPPRARGDAVERAPALPPNDGGLLAVRAPEVPEARQATTTPESPAAPPPAPPPRLLPRPEIEPLDAEQVRLHLTVSRRFLAKLQATKDALSHARPGADAAEVLEACLDLMLDRHAKRKGLVEKPRRSAGPEDPGTIPAAVKREVWRRAGGRCEFPLQSGGVCGSTCRLEFDHVRPRALGGPSTVDNVRLACREHNQLAARQVFGDSFMDGFTRRSAERRTRTGTAPRPDA